VGLGRVAVRGLTGPSGAREERVTRGERGSGGNGPLARWAGLRAEGKGREVVGRTRKRAGPRGFGWAGTTWVAELGWWVWVYLEFGFGPFPLLSNFYFLFLSDSYTQNSN